MATITITPKDTSAGRSNVASGTFTSDNTATTINIGFKARWVKVFNATDVIVWEKTGSMADANSIKTVTAGTTTVDATSAIVISDGYITLPATTVGNAKAIHWIAMD